jgi:hypothetical protein
MDFQEAIRKIEERGDFNRYAEVKPIFENRLAELKDGDYTERGLCYYYLLVSYMKGNLVHETQEAIEFYDKMEAAFMKQEDVYRKEHKKFSWSEIKDFFRLMERCYGSLEFLYKQHNFQARRRHAYKHKMRFRKDAYFFNKKFWHWLEYKFLEITCNYGTSLVRWATTTFAFSILMAVAFFINDHLIPDEALRTIVDDAHWFDYFYFSMINLTTVGFGDITPLSVSGKILSIFEAFFGFLMLGIFIGLIQKKL